MAQSEAGGAWDELRRRTVRRRGVEAAIWGIPAVNYALMFQAAARELQGGPNQIVYWSRLLDWRNQTLTPHPDAVPEHQGRAGRVGNPSCRGRRDHRHGDGWLAGAFGGRRSGRR